VLGEVHGGAHVEVDQAQHGLDPYDRTRSCTPTGRYERETARVSDDGARRGSAAASDAELPIPGRRIARHTVERVTAKSSSSARANQVRLKLGDHGQYAEQQPTDRPTDRVGRIVHRGAERELHLAARQLVGDRARPGATA